MVSARVRVFGRALERRLARHEPRAADRRRAAEARVLAALDATDGRPRRRPGVRERLRDMVAALLRAGLEPDPLEALGAQLRARGAKIETIAGDLSVPGVAERVRDAALN